MKERKKRRRSILKKNSEKYTYNRILITLTANRFKFIGLTAPSNKILYVFKILVFICVCVFEFFI
jgi:hypothetical protein